MYDDLSFNFLKASSLHSWRTNRILALKDGVGNWSYYSLYIRFAIQAHFLAFFQPNILAPPEIRPLLLTRLGILWRQSLDCKSFPHLMRSIWPFFNSSLIKVLGRMVFILFSPLGHVPLLICVHS